MSDIDKLVAEKVSKWFGEPVLAVEDEIKALVQQATDEAYRQGVETAVRTHHKQYPDCPPQLNTKGLDKRGK